MHKITVSIMKSEKWVMRTMCRCSRDIQNDGCLMMRRRCVCWCEPVRVRSRRRRHRHGSHIEGLSLQLSDVEDKHLSAGSPIIFDQILTDNSWYMCYDEDNGVIEIRKHGMYVIDWDLAVEGEPQESCVRFAIEVNGEVEASSTLPGTVGQLKGQALIHVDQVPTTVRLINDTHHDVQLSKFTPVANLRIFAIE